MLLPGQREQSLVWRNGQRVYVFADFDIVLQRARGNCPDFHRSTVSSHGKQCSIVGKRHAGNMLILKTESLPQLTARKSPHPYLPVLARTRDEVALGRNSRELHV